MSQPPLDLLTSRFADIQLSSGRALPVPASCTLASSCSSFDIDRLPSVCSPVLPQFMWRFNLIYESGERKEMKADPGEDKHCLIRPLPYHPPWMPWSQGGHRFPKREVCDFHSSGEFRGIQVFEVPNSISPVPHHNDGSHLSPLSTLSLE